MRHQQPVITREVASKIIYLFMKFEEVLLDLDLNFTLNTAGVVMSVNPEILLLSPMASFADESGFFNVCFLIFQGGIVNLSIFA